MNAYELADELNIHIKMGNDYEFLKQTVTMLRQQANLIAELEKQVDKLAGYKESYENCHKTCNGYGKTMKTLPEHETIQMLKDYIKFLEARLKHSDEGYERAMAILEREIRRK